jgi:hypothetical protein
MFVRKKGSYHYLVASQRTASGVRQTTLCYLGEFATVDAALAGIPEKIAYHQKELKKYDDDMASSKEARRQYFPDEQEPPRPTRRGWKQRASYRLRTHYWWAKKRAASHAQRLEEYTQRLEQFRSACSAQSAEQQTPRLGTTKKQHAAAQATLARKIRQRKGEK